MLETQLSIIIDLRHWFFIIIINMDVRTSLRAPRLIPWALKLTTMQTFGGHHISNHRARTCKSFNFKLLPLDYLLDG
jgi:hypothetical protein